jgi:hypothetical protein
MSFLYKKELGIFKPVEITIRRTLRCKKEKNWIKWKGCTNRTYKSYIHGNVIMILLI